MKNHFDKVRDYILELGYSIQRENPSEGVLLISDDRSGIRNLVIGCSDPLLIMEQYLFDTTDSQPDMYKALLMKNRDILHGASVLDDSGTKVIFRDTLQIENLDLNELEGSINSLSLLLAEYSDELIQFSKN